MNKPLIRAYLENQLKTWATGKSPQVPIAYEGVNFTKPATGLWCECFLMPNVTLNRNVGAVDTTEYGLFQVNVWGPRGNGAQAIEGMMAEVAALYPVVPKGTVSIEKPPHAGRIVQDNSGWLIGSVLIYYRYES